MLLVAECHHQTPELSDLDREVLVEARKGRGKIILALNKIDLIARKDALLPWMELYQREQDLAAIVPISARLGDGLDGLVRELVAVLPQSPPLFPTDLHTDQAERFLCAELVREQLLLHLREEVPYGAAVVIETFEDERRETAEGGSEGLCRLTGRIYVERESQKGIVVGKGGHMIKAVSQAARHEMEPLLGCKVFLRLEVHVEPDWTSDERAVRRFGYGPEGGGESW